MNESDLVAFEQVQIQSALSDLQPMIEACKADGDHDALVDAEELALLGAVQQKDAARPSLINWSKYRK